MERHEETKIVKDALKSVGINAKVEHGHGTAWGWLHINIGSSDQYGHNKANPLHEYRSCVICQAHNSLTDVALEVAQIVTGRHGEYSGNINVYSQKHWNKSKNQSEEIVQVLS
jgi:hypothetical protein